MAEKMVDKVTRLMKSPENIRNIAICAHIDHGKTTFSDNLLAGAGMMSKDDAGKALKLDFHADEQERGITIDTAAVSMVHTFEEKEFLPSCSILLYRENKRILPRSIRFHS